MTEEEAKTKWCPFARVKTETHTGALTTVNRQSDGARSQGSSCIGSACMAWRYDMEGIEKINPKYHSGYAGYCGIPGKP